MQGGQGQPGHWITAAEQEVEGTTTLWHLDDGLRWAPCSTSLIRVRRLRCLSIRCVRGLWLERHAFEDTRWLGENQLVHPEAIAF